MESAEARQRRYRLEGPWDQDGELGELDAQLDLVIGNDGRVTGLFSVVGDGPTSVDGVLSDQQLALKLQCDDGPSTFDLVGRFDGKVFRGHFKIDDEEVHPFQLSAAQEETTMGRQAPFENKKTANSADTEKQVAARMDVVAEQANGDLADDGADSEVMCQNCYSFHPSTAQRCECGYDFVKREMPPPAGNGKGWNRRTWALCVLMVVSWVIWSWLLGTQAVLGLMGAFSLLFGVVLLLNYIVMKTWPGWRASRDEGERRYQTFIRSEEVKQEVKRLAKAKAKIPHWHCEYCGKLTTVPHRRCQELKAPRP